MKHVVVIAIKYHMPNMKKVTSIDEFYMLLALNEAKKAYNEGEIPVGCVIVLGNQVIAKSHNTRHNTKSVFDHAEISAIKKANKKLNTWMLDDAVMYVTLEPCLMCTGAIMQSRIKRVVYGAKEPKFGALGSVIDISTIDNFNHHLEITSGIYENDCASLLKRFFQELRQKMKQNNQI